MKKLLKKLKSNTGWLVAGGLVVLAAGSVFAFTGTGSTVIENAENVTVQGNCDLVEEVGLGAASDYCDGTEATTNLCVVDVYTLTSSGTFTISGTTTFGDNATTTPSEHTYKPIHIDLGLHATSTAEDTVLVAGHYCNTGVPIDIRLDTWQLQVKTAAANFGTGHLTWGTTTVTTAGLDYAAGTNSFAATNTANLGSLVIASSTTGRFNLDGMYPWGFSDRYINNPSYATSTHGTYFDTFDTAYEKYNTSTPYSLKLGECVVIGWNMKAASSSEALTTGGGQLFDGAFYMDAWIN
uniref:Uncharacterized protein n=1 Tax=viral metagenome TaxID=1070528 RepID=A0A6H1ZWU2_9ZZZZ